MSCDFYRQHELGEIAGETFAQHARLCVECQRLLAQDEQLLLLTRSLAQPSASPFLWMKIENALRAEQQRESRMRPRFTSTQKLLAYAVAATLILAIGLGVFFKLSMKPSEDSRLLADAALERVEQKEKEYESAIAELERVTSPQLALLHTDLMLLYRDRLATIDTQIARCRAALGENPGNAHLRRYLLMALQDKKETLQELANHRAG
ncbi:hypothetical protein HUU05_16230 [candidate division KSB1 bacterium]|nr:hypothetical protein [candidate division KSB1 bacterium]